MRICIGCRRTGFNFNNWIIIANINAIDTDSLLSNAAEGGVNVEKKRREHLQVNCFFSQKQH